jgi:hypothetical protein
VRPVSFLPVQRSLIGAAPLRNKMRLPDTKNKEDESWMRIGTFDYEVSAFSKVHPGGSVILSYFGEVRCLKDSMPGYQPSVSRVALLVPASCA